jgi:hypothetical protein
MTKLSAFVRKTSSQLLQAYFDQTQVSMPGSIDWGSQEGKLAKPLLMAIDQMTPADHARVQADADRIADMTDQAGQVALNTVVTDREQFEKIKVGHDRALWVFLNNRPEFERAEEIRYADHYRRGAMWSGFVIEPGVDLNIDVAALARFKDALRTQLRSENIEIEHFQRVRVGYCGKEHHLTQMAIYSEGFPQDDLAFDGPDNLIRRSRRPVREAAMVYEQATGVIEVVGKEKDSRLDIARLAVRDLLGFDFKQNPLPLRRYDLAPLMRPNAFPVDPQDGIDSVKLKMLRLMPIDAPGERVTLECLSKSPHSIWELGARFSHADPLRSGFVCTQAELLIVFQPGAGSSKGSTLNLKITMPNGCNLKEQTPEQEMVADKYLRRWGLLEEA